MTSDAEQSEQSYKEPRGFADRLVERIRRYWAERGYDVQVHVGHAMRRNIIESDLVNGLPRNWRRK